MNIHVLPPPTHLNSLPLTLSDLSRTGGRRTPFTLARVSKTCVARLTARQPTRAVFFPAQTMAGTVLSVNRDASFGFPLFVVFSAVALFFSIRSPVLGLP